MKGESLIKKFQESLGSKIISSVIVSLFIILGTVYYLNISYVSKVVREHLLEEADLIGHAMTESVITLMQAAEQELLQKTVFEMGKNNGKLSIIDWNGIIKKSSTTSDIGKPFNLPGLNIQEALVGKKISAMSLNTKDKKIFTTLFPIKGEKACYKCHDTKLTYIGVIQADLNQAQGFLRIQLLRNFNIVVSLTGLFLIVVILLILLQKFLFKPLNKVIIYAKNLSSSGGDLAQKIQVTSKDEIGILGKAFNQMTENLQMTMVSKEFVENIIGSMSESLLVLNADLKIFMANDAAIRLTGYSLEELSGMPIQKILSEDAYLELLRQFKANPRGGRIGLDTHCLTKDGNKIPVIFNYSVIHDKDDLVVRIICNVNDISDRKKEEKKDKRRL